MPPKYAVQTIKQVSSFAQNGAPANSYVIQFTVGEHGPFTITVAQADFTPAAVKAKLDAFADSVSQIAAPAGA
ncbi:MAG: hypothetical protein ACRD4R_13000 [Candidatus Acidiferrales bacterium]